MALDSHRFLSPRFWPTWLSLGLLKAINLLPYQAQIRLGSWLGDVMRLLFRSRRHIAAVNIALCFPELSAEEQQALLKQTFRDNAIGIFETSMAWWTPDKRLTFRVEAKGEEHLTAALEKGQGVILLGAHFSTLDMGGRLITRFFPACAIYREHNNPLLDRVIKTAREQHLSEVIERESLRQVLRALRKNKVVWYAPDQDFGPKHSIYAPFFGVPAATIPATTRMAQLNNSPVLLYTHHRKADNSGYELEFFPPLADFPSGDELADATCVNQAIEQGIRKAPAQYMWVHRRFKTHPKGKNYLYRKGA